MISDQQVRSRREFLGILGQSSAAGLLAASPAAALAAEKAKLADPARDLKPAGAKLGNLYADVGKLLDANRYAYSFLGDRFQSFADHQRTSREKILDLLLYRPAKVDAQPEREARIDCGDFVLEKVWFSTGPHFRVPAVVLLPKGLNKPAPAVIDLHSHGGMYLFGKEKVVDLGANHPAMVAYHGRLYEGRPTATALVRRGYVVISIDAFYFGERRLLLDADLKYGWDRARYTLDDVKHLNQQCQDQDPAIGMALLFAGATWPGIVFWDDMRTVDYLLSRPEVDGKRIGCMGLSMGGYRSTFLAGLDERIAAGCVVGYMPSTGPLIKSNLVRSWVHQVPGLFRYLDLPDVAGLTAPRPLFVLQCDRDPLFPSGAMKAAVEKIAAIYDKAGAGGKFLSRFYDVPHMFSKTMQEEAFDWLDRQLKG